jgi:transposase
MAYPKKYRQRVLEFIEEGNTQQEAAKIFKVSRSTIQDWQRLRAKTGDLEKRELNRKASKYCPVKLRQIVEQEPDLYLFEIAEKFEGGTISGVHAALKREKLPLKKDQGIQRKR